MRYAEVAVDAPAGHERTFPRGPARVFDREEECFAAVQSGAIKPGDVVVIRYEGPVGGPGMPEMPGVTAAIVGAGLGDDGALAGFRLLSGTEGIIPALEPAHALAHLAKLVRDIPDDSVIVVGLSGRGDKDMETVAKALDVQLT